MRHLARILICVITLTLFFFIENSHQAITNEIPIWPKPFQTDISGSLTPVIVNHKTFKFDQGNVPTSGDVQQMLLAAIESYRTIMFYDDELPARTSSPLCQQTQKYLCLDSVKFVFNVTSAVDTELTLDMDERYALSVSSSSSVVVISCNTIWGAMRALESLSQLVVIKQLTNNAATEDYYVLNSQAPLSIKDAPRFKWRGLMIDTSRHYLSVGKIMQVVKALSYIKMNVLHWHMVDAQSFPLQVPDAPGLTKSAYTPKAIYTLEAVQKIISYARSLGIRVVIEIDIPGHAASWGVGYPEIVANCPSMSGNINNIPLNPVLDKTYEIVEQVIAAIAKVAPDNFIHLGGDELVKSCWKQDARIMNWMQQKGWTDLNQLVGYFESRLETIYRKYQKTMVSWEELLLAYGNYYPLPKDTIVQAWTSKQSLGRIIGAGYRGLLSAGWYMDKQVPGNTTHYLWGDTWEDFYKNDPTLGMGFTPEQESRVLGGDAAAWAEQVDPSNFETRVFPRLLGVAERLWSQASNTQDVDSARERLVFSRCHVLVRRNINAGPIRPDYCDAVEKYY